MLKYTIEERARLSRSRTPYDSQPALSLVNYLETGDSMSLSLKDRALATIDAKRDELVRISTTLHENPEIAFQEFKSAGLLCDTLEKYGFKVERDRKSVV
jgi:hypothetical protein